MKTFRHFLAGTALAASFITHAAYAETLNFGIISTDSSSALKQRWQPLIDDLNKQTGLDVKAFFATDYAGIIEAMRFNKVQIGFFGNASAIEAVDRSNGEVFAKVKYKSGEAGYYSLLITNVNSKWKSVDQVLKNSREINLGFGDPNSTSGTLVPSYYLLAKNGLSAKTSFKSVLPSSHEANLLAVVNDKIDVATNNTDMLDTLKAQHPDRYKEVRVLWKSPLIPSDPLVWRRDLPQATKDKLRSFFDHYAEKDPREQAIMHAISGYSGFADSSNAQLVPIRQMALFQKKEQVQSDAHMSDADKKTQLATLDQKLSELDTVAAK
ncbi:phosphonate ABC transporter binding protein [Caballeronia arationis]|jgi:phosphonate transport system substrate-binding protein|uniref:Phosphonate ABC transporter binding protein n=1 Tax=Caballeronia arationis TaxID=1777142 RepID=A0A7Z7N6W1_9BURK|nr:phosphonate ABC transporter substrate-binding protein [Caballeronia arationis]SOE88484.1 phosphonate ABC transporter binding protein [Caballeronia arationis]